VPRLQDAPRRSRRSHRQLEDELKEAQRRVTELRQERDEARDLVQRMQERLEDNDALIDSWIEAFDMQLNDNGNWQLPTWIIQVVP
jgi:hypothetical protein